MRKFPHIVFDFLANYSAHIKNPTYLWYNVFDKSEFVEKEDSEMKNNTSKQERKELNKKLLKKTFFSEFKSETKKRMSWIDFICAFIACLVAELIVKGLQIDFWLLDAVISIPIITIILFVLGVFVEKFKR